MEYQYDKKPSPHKLTRRRIIQLGLGGALGATAAKKISPELLDTVGHLLLRDSFSIEENSDRVVVTVADATGFGKALAELTHRRINDSRPFEIRLHRGRYAFENVQEISVPAMHPEKDEHPREIQTSVAITLPENTGLTAIDHGVEFELPASEIGILQRITGDTAEITFDGISFTSRGKVGNMGLAGGGVKAMMLIIGDDPPSDARSVTLRNCSFNEETTYDIYYPYKKYRTDFRSGVIVSNMHKLQLDTVRVQNPRWDGILGINVTNLAADNCRVERHQPERTRIVGSAIALINRGSSKAELSIKNFIIRNFRKCIGAFEGPIDIKADTVFCDQDDAFYVEDKPGWVFGGEDFNLYARRVRTKGPMFGAFLVKTGNKPGTYRFEECTFDINNDPKQNDDRGFPFRIVQLTNGELNSKVIGVNSEIRLTYHWDDDERIIAKLTRLPGFIYGVHDDILPSGTSSE